MNDAMVLTDRLVEVESHVVTDDEETAILTETPEVVETAVDTAVRATEQATMDLMEMKSESDIGSLELKKISEEVDGMTYIQLRATQRQLQNNLTMVEGYRAIYDQFSAVSGDMTESAAKINLTNQITSAGIDQPAQAFNEEYDTIRDNISAVLDLIAPKLEAYGELAKSSTFLTDQMIQSIDQRIESVKESLDCNPYTLECYEELRKIYADRTKAIDYMKNYRKDLRKMKKMARTKSESIMKRIRADLANHFTVNSMGATEQFLVKAWGGSPEAESAAIVCLGMLAKAMETDKYLNHGENAKIFIMNALDILADIWDLKEMTADEYTEQVKGLFPYYRLDDESAS